MTMSRDWAPLKTHYETCLERFGATPQGVDWPNQVDLTARFDTLVSVLSAVSVEQRPVRMLDLGCGTGLILDYLKGRPDLPPIYYHGIDISERMIDVARSRWPDATFEVRDIIADPLPPRSVDVVVMNGVLTERQSIPRERMITLAKTLIKAAFDSARAGVAFNVMSRHVDWERDDLFHWSFDEIATFLTKEVTRHVAFRADYGLYELSAFAYRFPQRRGAAGDGDPQDDA